MLRRFSKRSEEHFTMSRTAGKDTCGPMSRWVCMIRVYFVWSWSGCYPSCFRRDSGVATYRTNLVRRPLRCVSAPNALDRAVLIMRVSSYSYLLELEDRAPELYLSPTQLQQLGLLYTGCLYDQRLNRHFRL